MTSRKRTTKDVDTDRVEDNISKTKKERECEQQSTLQIKSSHVDTIESKPKKGKRIEWVDDEHEYGDKLYGTTTLKPVIVGDSIDKQPDEQTALPLGVHSRMLVEDAIVKIEKELTSEHIVTLRMDFNSEVERFETRRRLTAHFGSRVQWEDDKIQKTLKYPCVLQVMFFSKAFFSLGDDANTRQQLLDALQIASWNAGPDNAVDADVFKSIVENVMSKKATK